MLIGRLDIIKVSVLPSYNTESVECQQVLWWTSTKSCWRSVSPGVEEVVVHTGILVHGAMVKGFCLGFEASLGYIMSGQLRLGYICRKALSHCTSLWSRQRPALPWKNVTTCQVSMWKDGQLCPQSLTQLYSRGNGRVQILRIADAGVQSPQNTQFAVPQLNMTLPQNPGILFFNIFPNKSKT